MSNRSRKFFLWSDMVSFFQEKFIQHTSSNYKFKQIDAKLLDLERAATTLRNFQTIEELTWYQIIVFQPRLTAIKDVYRLSICQDYKTK